MLGYVGEDIDDFIDSLTRDKVKTYKKGKQTSIFCYEEQTTKDDYPLLFGGDFIMDQRYEMNNKEWQQHNYFQPTSNGFVCYSLPEDTTGNIRIIYGKYVQNIRSNTLTQNTEFYKSCESISKTLKEIDVTNKQHEFQNTNFSSNKKYRVPKAAIRK